MNELPGEDDLGEDWFSKNLEYNQFQHRNRGHTVANIKKSG